MEVLLVLLSERKRGRRRLAACSTDTLMKCSRLTDIKWMTSLQPSIFAILVVRGTVTWRVWMPLSTPRKYIVFKAKFENMSSLRCWVAGFRIRGLGVNDIDDDVGINLFVLLVYVY